MSTSPRRREFIRLMVDLVLMLDTELAGHEAVIRTVNDCCCGIGGILTLTKDRIQQINPQTKVFLYGKELNPQTWAIARSDMLILGPEGKDAENIKLPVCFWFAGRNTTVDHANVTRLFAGETELSLVA